ncbi:phosphotransferase enzyme family protein [Murinocardiopsis flavida]|nr:phosphotransferase [Murinocardiopsis flavida]
MSFAATPLTAAMRRAIAHAWGHTVDDRAVRLFGGEESAAYRTGALVVRVGPLGRGNAEMEWCHSIAAHAAQRLPEAVAPLRTRDGGTVVRAEGRPLSLWRFVDGERPDPAQADTAEQAAGLLARLHRALASLRPAPRPTRTLLEAGLDGRPTGDAPTPPDPALDQWLADFHRRAPVSHPLHGDFYSGNTLTQGGRLVALFDWDEAMTGPPELEVASAAMEWSGGFDGPAEARRRFITAYQQAGGTAGDMDEQTTVQLIRHRLRSEAAYVERARGNEAGQDAGDLDYHRRRIAAFTRLRP